MIQEKNTIEREEIKVLIVDDQIDTLRPLEGAVKEVFTRHYQGRFGGYDTARGYNDAQKAVEENGYDFVLLDHRMPKEAMKLPETLEKGGSLNDLTDEEAEAYFLEEDRIASQIKGIGYNLIPEIKARNDRTIVIGTSSADNLTEFPKPDYAINKIGLENAIDGLERIVKKLKGGNE